MSETTGVREACEVLTSTMLAANEVTRTPEESRELGRLSQGLSDSRRLVNDLSPDEKRALAATCRAVDFQTIAEQLRTFETLLADAQAAQLEARRDGEILIACDALRASQEPIIAGAEDLLSQLERVEAWIATSWTVDSQIRFIEECDLIDADNLTEVLQGAQQRVAQRVEEVQAEIEQAAQQRVEERLQRGLDGMERWWNTLPWATQSVMCISFDEDPVPHSRQWSSVANGGSVFSATAGAARPEDAFVFFSEACNDQMRDRCTFAPSICSGIIDWTLPPD